MITIILYSPSFIISFQNVNKLNISSYHFFFEQNNIIFFYSLYYIVTVIIAVMLLYYILYSSFFLSQVVNINLNNILDLSRYIISCNPNKLTLQITNFCVRLIGYNVIIYLFMFLFYK